MRVATEEEVSRFIIEKFKNDISTIRSGMRDTAIVISAPSDTIYEDLCKWDNYVFIERPNKNGRSSLFVCRNQNVVNNLMERGVNLHTGEGLNQKTFGIILGYPPAAVRSFTGMNSKRLNVNFNGLCFVSFEKTLEEDLRYLFKHSLPNNMTGFFCTIESWDRKCLMNILYDSKSKVFI